MTMQVGMVGTDGILLASDTLWTQNPVLATKRWGRPRSFTKSKIKISNAKGMAISCARDMDIACEIADKIMNGLQPSDFSDPIPRIIEIGTDVSSLEKDTAQCLIVLMRPSMHLFWFQSAMENGQRVTSCENSEPMAIAGDNLNPAIFWAEKYCRPPCSIDKLIPIAAHLVIGARQFNPSVIDGLEIVRCRESGIQHLSEISIAELKVKVADWDKQIDRLLLEHQQQYMDAPEKTALF